MGSVQHAPGTEFSFVSVFKDYKRRLAALEAFVAQLNSGAADDVSTKETTTSTTAADLATVGPTCTVQVGLSGAVSISSYAQGGPTAPGAGGASAFTWIYYTGPTSGTVLAAAMTDDGSNANLVPLGRTQLISGLTPEGTYTFKLQYSVSAGNTASFQDRNLYVQPI
jgi:hypothetical protein